MLVRSLAVLRGAAPGIIELGSKARPLSRSFTLDPVALKPFAPLLETASSDAAKGGGAVAECAASSANELLADRLESLS